MEISLCMIVKDEEKTIDRCLNSIKQIVDEIIIVDTGSSDNTIDKAKEHGAIVYEFEWVDDFSKARNFAFSKATKDYIFWFDADDILKNEDIEKFNQLKENLQDNIDSVTMNYILQLDENGEARYYLKRNRLIKRNKNFRWIGKVHEYLDVYGNIIHSDINIIHKKDKPYTNRNLKIYESLISRGEELSPRDIFYYGNELYDNKLYDKAIEQYTKFIDSEKGWIEDIKSACSKLSECYKYKNDKENELKYILKSFEYDVPRADFCCKLGDKFLNENNLNTAIYWYEEAIRAVPKEYNMSLVDYSVFTYLPWIQLCICYFKKGDLRESYICNEMAAKYKQDDECVKYNREYFKDKIDKNTIEELKKFL